MENQHLSCIDCGVTACNKKKNIPDKAFPDFCITANMDTNILTNALSEYEKDEIRRVTLAAAEVEFENYCKMNRIEEIMEFAKKLGYKKLGVATCAGLIREARVLGKILRSHGFEVVGVACKAGAQAKHTVGISECCEDLGVNMCNPIFQAQYLNEQKTELNLLVGLCVGHDSLFYKYSDALVTTVFTKDRVLGNNAVQAIYTAETYYKRMFGNE